MLAGEVGCEGNGVDLGVSMSDSLQTSPDACCDALARIAGDSIEGSGNRDGALSDRAADLSKRREAVRFDLKGDAGISERGGKYKSFSAA